MRNFKEGTGMKHLCNSLLLCGIAFLWVPAANAQDIIRRRVTDRVITLSMSNLGMKAIANKIVYSKGVMKDAVTSQD
jgi:hypothetical protein